MNAQGILYIVSAPSGAGKTSLINRLLAITSGVELSVSYTTRPPRPGEQDGVDYHFIDPHRFQRLLAQEALLEHAVVYDHYYGTGRQTVLDRLAADVDVILEIDWQGARQVRAQLPDSRSIFIVPPSRETLRQRLQNRGQDAAAVIERRMQDAISELSHYHEFDYLIVNDDFDAALDALRAILIANRQLRAAQVARHGKQLSDLLS